MWIYGVKDSEGKDMPLEVRVFGPKKEDKELTDEEKAKEEKSKKTKKKVAIGIVAGAAAVIGGILGYSKYADSKKSKELPSSEDDTKLLEADDSDDDDDTVDVDVDTEE